MLNPADKLFGFVNQSMGGPKSTLGSLSAPIPPVNSDINWSSKGSYVSPVTGFCTVWVWAAANQAGGPSAGGGAAMKTIAVHKGDTIGWSCDATGNVNVSLNWNLIGFGAKAPTDVFTPGSGFGGDINRTGTQASQSPFWISGASPDFSDTYLAIGSAGDGSLWRGGHGGVERSGATGGGGGGVTPGGGGGDTSDAGPAYYSGGKGRVIMVFAGADS